MAKSVDKNKINEAKAKAAAKARSSKVSKASKGKNKPMSWFKVL